MLGKVLTAEQERIKVFMAQYQDRFSDIYLPPEGENYKVVKDLETGYCYLQGQNILEEEGVMLLIDGNGDPMLCVG